MRLGNATLGLGALIRDSTKAENFHSATISEALWGTTAWARRRWTGMGMGGFTAPRGILKQAMLAEDELGDML